MSTSGTGHEATLGSSATEDSSSRRGNPAMQRVLAIRLGAFGDVVRTVPAVYALKKKYPNARITWLVDQGSANFLEGLEFLDSVVVLSRKGFFVDFRNALKALRRIRRLDFTCILDFHGLSRSGLFSLLSGCRIRAGFAREHVREFNHLFSNIFVDPGTELISRYEQNHRLVETFDVPSRKEPPPILVPEHEKREVDEFVASLGAKPFVCMHPGTSWRGRYKRWWPERFAEVADSIVEKHGLNVVLLFTPEEKEIADAIVAGSRNELHLSPRINQRQLAHIISLARLYVGLDSGSMHVASLAATPIVALFGPSDVIQNRPHDYAPFRVVHGDAECAPCRIRNCQERHCMDAIQAEDVIEAVDEILYETR